MKTDDTSLRPASLEEFVGQERLKANLRVFLDAAKSRGEALDHCLLDGPGGLGKTTLAAILAAEMGSRLVEAMGTNLRRPQDVVRLVARIRERDVVFIDEIHAMSKEAEESLYTVMEDFAFHGSSEAGAFRMAVPRFTLVGATTRVGEVSGPLRDRFGIAARMCLYSEQELGSIVRRSAALLGVGCDAAGALAVARRSRGTPRVANSLLRRVRDFVRGGITGENAPEALDRLEIDALGLNPLDRRLLRTIAESFGGGPAGIETLAATLGESVETVGGAVEPYLLQIGLLARTARGRVVTEKGLAHLGAA